MVDKERQILYSAGERSPQASQQNEFGKLPAMPSIHTPHSASHGAPDESPIAAPSELELFHFLLEHIPDRIYFKDHQSRFLCASKAMSQFFRAKSPADLVGRTDFDFFTKEHAQAAFNDELHVMSTGRAIVGKVEKETLMDGRLRWAITTKMPLRDADERIIGTCGISKDFTAQKALEDRLEETNASLAARQAELQDTLAELHVAHENLKSMQDQLLEAEKMQLAGRLAYGVAHEIRNPLNILNAGLDYLSSEPAIVQDSSNSLILDEMKTAVRRADVVICALMDSSATRHLKLESCKVDNIISQSLQILRTELEANHIKVETNIDPALPEVKLDRSKMQQVFAGICGNSIDAMENGGSLMISAATKKLTADEVERDPGLRSGERFRAGETIMEVKIEDTGTGIPTEALTKIFDPFFTTKETGQGTGMGLTVCRKIVQLHHGLMQIENRDEGGVRVTLNLKLELGTGSSY